MLCGRQLQLLQDRWLLSITTLASFLLPLNPPTEAVLHLAAGRLEFEWSRRFQCRRRLIKEDRPGTRERGFLEPWLCKPSCSSQGHSRGVAFCRSGTSEIIRLVVCLCCAADCRGTRQRRRASGKESARVDGRGSSAVDSIRRTTTGPRANQPSDLQAQRGADLHSN